MGSGDDIKAVRSYQDLDVWKKAMDLVVLTYKEINGFPQHEVYGLTSQMKRASVSVAANIAEGRARRYKKEYLHHLSIAYGSLAELETHAMIAERLGYLIAERVRQILDKTSEVGKMLNGLRKSLERK